MCGFFYKMNEDEIYKKIKKITNLFDVVQESGTSGYAQSIVGSTTGTLITSLPATIAQSVRASSNNLTIGVISVILTSSTVSVDNIFIQEVATTDFIPKNFASTAFKKHRLKGGILA